MQPEITQQRLAAANRRTLWRWHFYAALFVMPLLLILAITGTIYCFQPQIEPLLYRERMVVEPAATPRLTAATLLASAAASQPPGATPTTAQISDDPRRSAEFVFRALSGESESVYVNPYTGVVLGSLSVEHRLMKQVRDLHRALMLGKTGELLMELAACWTLVMIGTGVALWWPAARVVRDANGANGASGANGSSGAQFVPRLSLRGRAWWRDLHMAGGIWLAAGALFFVLSGLPWSGNWGKQFKGLATSAQLGYPKGAWGEAHVHSAAPSQKRGEATDNTAHSMPAAHAAHAMKMDDLPLPATPWAVGQTPVPEAPPESAHAARLPLDAVIAIAASQGVVSGYSIALPNTARGVYTVSYFPADPKTERTLHIDQYDGRILSDIAYGDYGPVAQWVSYGTSLHMGRYFGVANQLLAAAISLGLAALAVTGFVMWWKRRPERALGAPPRPATPVPMRAWRGGLALLGVVFPLMGATMLLVWLGERVVFSRRAAA